MDADSERPIRGIPSNADIEALLRAPNRTSPVSEAHPLVFHVRTADLDKLLARGLEFQRGLLEACEAERDEVAEQFARAVQARIDFADYMKSECLGMIEISLFPTARNWCWEVEEAFESGASEEEEEDELFGDEDEDGEY